MKDNFCLLGYYWIDCYFNHCEIRNIQVNQTEQINIRSNTNLWTYFILHNAPVCKITPVLFLENNFISQQITLCR